MKFLLKDRKTEVLIIGSGLSAYFCKKELGNKAIVISSDNKNNSLISGKAIRTIGINKKPLYESILDTGQKLCEREKVSYFCKNIKKLNTLEEFSHKTNWKNNGFKTNFSFLLKFQKNIKKAQLQKILVENNTIIGAIVKPFKSKKSLIIKCNAIVLCSGGYSHLFKNNDSSKYPKTTPLEIAFNIGAEVKDIEFIFHHPFGFNNKILPTELLQDAKIISTKKSANLIKAPLKKRNAHHLLSKITRILAEDPNIKIIIKKQKYKLVPLTHTTLGGLVTDNKNMTNIKGLFAAGEICAGLHGADRIGGTALAEAIIFGEKTGKNVKEYCKKTNFPKAPAKKITALNQTNQIKDSSRILSKYFKVINSKKNLLEGLNVAKKEHNYFCEAIFTAALARKESRGCFFRKDFPKKSKKFRKSIKFRFNGKEITPHE